MAVGMIPISAPPVSQSQAFPQPLHKLESEGESYSKERSLVEQICRSRKRLSLLTEQKLGFFFLL